MATVNWHPGRLLQPPSANVNPPEFALLILNQPIKNGANLRKLWKNSTQRIAADGGANRLHELSSFQGKYSNLQAIVGDLDSLRPSVRDFYLSQPKPTEIVHMPDQESTDFLKSVNWIRSHCASPTDIVALGGIGGRVDQGLSQLHHLYLFQADDAAYAKGRVYLLSGSSLTFLLKAGSHHIHVREDGVDNEFGKHVGIIPLKGTSRITTSGLEWDVEDWETEIGGKVSTSNHVLPDTRVVEIQTTADVLFTIALRQLDTEEEGQM
ncbi:thiamine pyrophosphokinase [Stachybotrys elegans]|uniref:Thiamine pyrophosphokinase n=1 Tax=Stachybotrys elegans TaxID=80388 RepID=A0A8K0SXP3_9HYPO|nr:thiamine pyrophosphokinase [Stachybotrys elegans]